MNGVACCEKCVPFCNLWTCGEEEGLGPVQHGEEEGLGPVQHGEEEGLGPVQHGG